MRAIRKNVTAFLAALALAAPAPATAKGPAWRRADTSNFVIYSQGSEVQLRQFANDLERFDALLREFLSVPATEQKPYRLTIYALPNSNSVAKLFSRKRSDVAGFYVASLEGSYAVSNRQKASNKLELDGSVVLFHEYAHHFMHRNFNGSYPLWFNEGFAEYYSTTAFDKDGRFKVGMPAYHRAYGLIRGNDVSIKQLLFTSSLSALKRSERDPFYGRAWLLIHFLMNNEEGQKKLLGYLHDHAGGMDPREAAERNFGDLKALDKALDQYLTGKMSYRVSSAPMALQPAVEMRPLDPIESALVPLRLKIASQSDCVAVRDDLVELAKQNPGRAEIWFELARAQINAAHHEATDPGDAGDPDAESDNAETNRQRTRTGDLGEVSDSYLAAADEAVGKALAIDKTHGRANVLKADIMMERLLRADTSSEQDWDEARGYIIAANRADTEDPVPLVAWYRSFARMGETPSKSAEDGLVKAFTLAKEATEVRLMLAFDLARRGEFDTAISLVKILANDPHAGEYGRAALAQLEAMQARQSSRIAPAKAAAD
ncbi:hypothetical protein U8326_08365 [Tsuneonella sp. CC-YZS046]|uniref:hypothetical protein n=1 Tax=Tsuneonella sp. CC-YZS046 TaxID=3042152 RepID=UPI002D77E024|nr:hypothetical protein [Tsuneonella sp. CC-YZS046]WRO65094.1 hypothetical protein U8326_08365 [Tsuneonella sp. CC-YZS046]